MIKIFLNTISRTLLKNKRDSLISIGGLAIGIAAVMLIGLWINSELSFNKCHKNYNTIARVMTNEDSNGQIFTNNVQAIGLGALLKTSYGNYFEKMAIVRSQIENRVVANGEKKFTENGYFMQPDGPEMFSLDMINGSIDGLKDMNSILLSESLAKKLFGNENPVNQIVKMDARWDLKVTGVYKDLPSNSEFWEASYFAPLDRYIAGWLTPESWDTYNMKIYVQVHPGTDFEKVSNSIKDIIKLRATDSKSKVFLLPMSKWHLYSQFENGANVTSEQLKYVLMFGVIGFFVLLLACINFMNYYTARSEKYAKEIGIRKTIGAKRFELVRKFLGQSSVVMVFAFILAIIIVNLVIPFFSQLTGSELHLPWNNLYFWLICLGFIVFTSLMAGSYPAFYLSSFKPIEAINVKRHSSEFISLPRKILVIFQFVVTISLIIGTIMVNKQVQFAKDRPVGYTREGLLSLRPGTPDFVEKFGLLREELLKTGVVDEAAASNFSVTNTIGNSNGIYWTGKDPEFDPTFNIVNASFEYGKTIGLQIIEGRDFSRKLHSDLSGVVINQSALKLFGFKKPIGETIMKDGRNYTILGVIKDIIKGSPFENAKASLVFLTEDEFKWLYIRINPNLSDNVALQRIESAFNKIIPSAPFDYKFVVQEYNVKFKEKERIGKMAVLLTFLAIIISCLGLFGLVTFLTEKRSKEIGIRKINGAKVSEIMAMLNMEFIKWVVISFVIACPIAYYIMNKWLDNFAYKTELSWWIFALAGLLAFVVALLTVSWQSWRAASMNPVESLRYE